MSTDAEIARRTAELIDRLSRLTRELQYKAGLNPAQWEALRFIQRANRYSRTPGSLAEFLGTTRGTVSQTLITLERKGHVRRVRSQKDRRVVELELTDDGRVLLADDPVLKIEQMVCGVDQHDGAAMVRGLSRLLRDLQSEIGAKEFGICRLCSKLCEPAAVDGGNAERRCGVTGEALPASELTRICVSFRARS